MRFSALVMGIVLLLPWSALADSLYDRCQSKKAEIAEMQNRERELGTSVDQIAQRLGALERQMRDLRAERSEKLREQAKLRKRIKRSEAGHKRMCSPLMKCEAYERQIAALQKRAEPIGNLRQRIRDEIRRRHDEAKRLGRDVKRIENRYGHLGCENLRIGETDQKTFDACSQLSKEWNDIKARIEELNRSVLDLRRRYREAMDRSKGYSDELAGLLKKMRQSCGHSQRLAELESMERDQDEYRGLKNDLDEMDKRVKGFHQLKMMRKLKRAPDKPGLKEAPPDEGRKKKRHQLRPVR
ncbi:MAG: hypothetical protein JXR96_27420 [Deltaproteobacteria bacterium]|nr:hypothetical protein [Deltaproteobacteria bacterium]